MQLNNIIFATFCYLFQPYPYSHWQYHLTIFAILIPKWCKYPILGSKNKRGDIRLYFKTNEKIDRWHCKLYQMGVKRTGRT